MRILRILICFIAMFVASCPIALAKNHDASGPMPCPGWAQQVGKKITLVGIAQNAKLGAVILVDQEAIYLEGKDSWDEKTLNRKIRVTGTLGEFSPPVATRNEKGEWSAGVGAPGSAYRLQKFTWEPADTHE